MPPAIPPPNGYLNGPCGLAVDSGGRFYVADHYHNRVHVYDGAADYLSSPPVYGKRGYITQLSTSNPDAGPCYLALDSAGYVYVGDYHGAVRKYSPDVYPPTAGADPPDTGTPYTDAGLIDSGPSTGLAVDSATDDLYVNLRDRVSVYDSTGTHQLDIGVGELGEGYGVAVSGYPGTAGFVYVADASDHMVKVFDPGDGSRYPDNPSATIAGPPGDFNSLRDSAVGVDDTTGDVYVIDDIQSAGTAQPRGRVQVFNSSGGYQGHLKYDVVDGAPSGITVDNSAVNPRRVYVTSGNTHSAGIYAYRYGSATNAAPLAPSIPPLLGGDTLFPTVPIGAAAPPPGGIACDGDACQVLPPVPVDPTLTTLLKGIGNPEPHYKRYRHRAKKKKKKHNHKRRKAHKGKKKHKRPAAAARASLAGSTQVAVTGPGVTQPTLTIGAEGGTGAPIALGLLPGAAGFDAAVWSDGEAATQAGSHPYSLEFGVGLDQGGGPSDLRDLRIELPPGLLLNSGFSATLCSASQFSTPRASSSPFAGSLSGESCPDRSQVGTVEVRSGADGTRRFGLFQIDPVAGSAFRLGASPFGQPLVFEAQIDSDQRGTYLVLSATDVPGGLQAQGLNLALWGAPWDATHNAERGNCLNEAGPGFPWAKCSVGDPLSIPPRAFLTLPTECRDSLVFSAVVGSWQQGGEQNATAVNRDSGGDPAPITDCSSFAYSPTPEGYLSVLKASSSSGFAFRFSDSDQNGHPDPGLANPRRRIRALTRKMVVALPQGVTLNPSLGAGLQTCSPAQLANESAFNPPGAGCPNGAKIGTFSIRLPFYDGLLTGGMYLAQPDDSATSAAGAENPFDTLLAVYLIAKSADRGILITAPGKLVPDPSDGTLTATFDDLPQLPYTDLEVNFKTGQRAPLVSPPSCGLGDYEDHSDPMGGGGGEQNGQLPLADQLRHRLRPLPRRLDPALLTGCDRRRGKRKRRLLHPLLHPPQPQGSRAGDHLLLLGAAEGHHRQNRRNPLLPGGGDRGGAAPAGLR